MQGITPSSILTLTLAFTSVANAQDNELRETESTVNESFQTPEAFLDPTSEQEAGIRASRPGTNQTQTVLARIATSLPLTFLIGLAAVATGLGLGLVRTRRGH